MSSGKYARQARYTAAHAKLIQLKIILTTEMDIWEKLQSVPNKNGYIKSLIRADIANSKQERTNDNEEV